ncbi:MAG: chloride channel protein [Hyphomicrobiales bacterium]|nr:chloride channel protein [Hyphomicrobiales bacterium]MDE2113505.1 chloride channel protein [Hyphomicrobiales bacterium]
MRAPDRVRAFVRSDEIGILITALIIGVLSGTTVAMVSAFTQKVHEVLFNLAPGQRLSALTVRPNLLVFLAPAVGGILLGVFAYFTRPWTKRPLIDPIEANALFGGRLALSDSLVVLGQNIISNGFGASIGLEAGYTQIAAGLASRIGVSLQVRRSDLRLLLGCGAAAAIATAFNAPLTGSFYAFELIIGAYTVASLLPVVASALVAVFTARALVGNLPLIAIEDPGVTIHGNYLIAFVLGLFSAGLGIIVMQCVTTVETMSRRSKIPVFYRPILGGLFVGLAALIAPSVLSAGHGAMHLTVSERSSITALTVLIVLKILAASVSIGTGFRGGLFFASLFMGSIFGKIFALVGTGLFPALHLASPLYSIVGMSALTVAVIGGPMTMTFMALEMTGDFQITALVLVAVLASSMLVRRVFGYSFATWRFHLRGENIRSAHDIGWMRNLTVKRLMRTGVTTVLQSMPLHDFQHDYPLGSAQRIVVLDDKERYAGLVLVNEAYAVDLEHNADLTVKDVMRYTNDFLLPEMNAKQAVTLFDKVESEELAVLDTSASRRVIGLLTEAHTLRRYSEELDRIRRDAQGER